MVINPSQMEMGMLILMLVRRPRATAGGVLRRRHHRTRHLARPREVVRYESFLEKGGYSQETGRLCSSTLVPGGHA
jgi:hypothetical protein